MATVYNCAQWCLRKYSAVKLNLIHCVNCVIIITFYVQYLLMSVCVCVQEVLVEQRTALSDLLQQLLKQRDQREQELRQILVRKWLLWTGPSGLLVTVRGATFWNETSKTDIHGLRRQIQKTEPHTAPHFHPIRFHPFVNIPRLSWGSLPHINSNSLTPRRFQNY